jgi:hypothetical protein
MAGFCELAIGLRPPKLAAPGAKSPIVYSMNRIGRRIIMCMLLIVALAVIWNLLGH